MEFSDNARPSLPSVCHGDGCLRVMVVLIGPFAMIDGKLRQARKGATVAVDSCAEVWLVWVATRRGVRAVEGARLESV